MLLTAISALVQVALLLLTVAHPLPFVEDKAFVKRLGTETSQANTPPPECDYVSIYPRKRRQIIYRTSGTNRTDHILTPMIKFSGTAISELKNLHGKERRTAMRWHTRKMKKEMESNPMLSDARVGVILHIAHEGGRIVKEPKHITASFYDRLNQHISAKDDSTGLLYPKHHVYV
jgi:hypothetical protein